jgi:type IV pilus assembly protein PilW
MRARGFSLVEFMIAVTIGLFMVAGLVYLIAETSRSRAEIERSSRQIENGRYALDRIAEDLRHAGFYGDFIDTSAFVVPGTTNDAKACSTLIGDMPAGMALGVQGYNGGGSVPSDLGTCTLLTDYKPNTDILVVRRSSTSSIAKASATNVNQPYIQATPLAYQVNVGPAANFTLRLPSNNSTAEVDAPVRNYMVRIYYVSNSDDSGAAVPTLRMLELGAGTSGPAFTKYSIAEGIEQMQFDFGIDDTPTSVSTETGLIGDGVVDGAYIACAPCTTAQWTNVVAVQMYLVARNTEKSPDYVDDKTYALGTFGNFTPASADTGYRRHAYTTVVRLNNISMRRDGRKD